MFCQNLEDIQYHLDRDYTLINDIDCSGTKNWNNGLGFNPIGNDTIGFSYQGILEGNEYSIDNLYIYQPWYENENGNLHITGGIDMALFAQLSGTIQNLSLNNFDITGENQVGTLVGNSTGNIINCEVEGHVYGDTNVGGLVGVINSGMINNSISHVHLNAKEHCGGLVGWNIGDIYNSSSNNTIHCSGSSDGGESSLSNNVNGGSAIGGGLVGLNDGDIYNSNSIAEVRNTPGWYLNNNMGFTFYNTHKPLLSSWVFGTREGDTIGGLIGTNTGTAINCSFSGTVNIQATVTNDIGWNGWSTVVFPKETPTVSITWGGGYGGSDGSGFTGINEGIINTSYSTINKFIGTNTADGELNNVYSNSSSSFIGINRGKVHNAYTLGSALIDSSLGIYVEVSSSFYKGSLGTNSEYGFAKTETQLKDIKTYTAEGWSTNCPGVFRRIFWWLVSSGTFSIIDRPSCSLTLSNSWDFLPNSTTGLNYFDDNGNDSIWNMDDITSDNLNNGYPIFTWQNNTNMINESGEFPVPGFSSIPADSWINYTQPLLTGNFILTENADTLFVNTTFNGNLINTNDSFNFTETSAIAFQIVNTTRLKVGAYVLNMTINNTMGNTSSILYNVTVNKSSPISGMFWTGNSSIVYGTMSDFVMNIEPWLNETADDCIWYRNLPNADNYPVGTYTFNMSTLGCTNYTSGYVLKNLTVTSPPPDGGGEEPPAPDITGPLYYSNSINNTANGIITKFSIIINDDRALNSAGTYTFSTNNTGSWVNDTYGVFVSTPQTIFTNKILNSTVGYVVGYQWFLTDNVGNGASTPIYTMTVEATNTISNNYSSDTPDNNSWLMYGRNLNRASYDSISYLAKATSVQIRTLDTITYTKPIVINGFVYTSDNSGNYFKFNASNISLNYLESGTLSGSKLIAVDDILYFSDNVDKAVYTANAITLNHITNFDEFPATGYFYNSPALMGEFIYFGGTGGYVYQVNKTDMNLYAKYYNGGIEFDSSGIAISNSSVYIGDIEGNVYQLNVNNVSQLQSMFDTNEEIQSSPAVYNNYLYISTNMSLYQLDASNITNHISNFSTGDTNDMSPAIDNDYVYIGSTLGFYQLNSSNVSQQINNNSQIINAGPVVYGNYIYGVNGNSIYQFNATNVSKLTGTYTTSDITYFEMPAIANGYIYIGGRKSVNGFLYQIPVSSFIELPIVTISIPGEGINYAVNDSLQLNFSALSEGYGIDMCWYQIINATGIIIDNTTIPSCTNTTFGVPAGNYNYNITLWANNSLGILNSDIVQFGVITEGPAINLYSPSAWSSSKNNYFNFTATSPVGLDTCQLWGNWSGGWHMNYTWINPTNDTMNFTQLVLPNDNPYFYGIWCNNTNGQETWSNNFTFNIDTVNPLVSITTVNNTAFATESATISFNITENNIYSCTYDLRNNGTLVSNLSNISIPNCSAPSFTFAALAGQYTFQLWIIDKAGNMNQSMITFTTTVPVGGAPGGGGVTVVVGNLSWSMETSSGGNRYQFNMIHGTSRSNDILFENLGVEPLVITMSCEYVSGLTDLCKYVTYEYASFDLPVEKEIKVPIGFTVTIPEDFEKGDYVINLAATDDKGNLAILTTEVNVETFGQLTRLSVKLTSSRLIFGVKIGYAWIFLFLWLILSIVFSYIYKKAKIKANIGFGVITGLFLSFIIILFI